MTGFLGVYAHFLLEKLKNPKIFPALRAGKLIAVTKIISVTEVLADPKP